MSLAGLSLLGASGWSEGLEPFLWFASSFFLSFFLSLYLTRSRPRISQQHLAPSLLCTVALLSTVIRLFANKFAPSILTVPVEFSTRIIGAFVMSRMDHFPSESGALWRQGLAIAMLLEGVLFISVMGRRFVSLCPCVARSSCQVLRQSFLLPSCLLASAAALVTAAICSRKWHRNELQLRTVLFWLVVITIGGLEAVTFRVIVTAVFFFSPSGPAPNAFVSGAVIVWVG